MKADKIAPQEITEEESESMLTIQQAARMMSVSERLLYRYNDNGTLPYYKVKNKPRRYMKKEDCMGLFKKAE
ncbi:helix-turn-helix domain-containing protein [Lewinella cohaerens]|uniref:helix-turn-helix domain-containing protein n=1 Tax=Lewinella cohaerens TaxID=70995 RepID=UPI0003717677|nr:helix-turn-helix domain-containing protein [Lewinella cohaerens]